MRQRQPNDLFDGPVVSSPQQPIATKLLAGQPVDAQEQALLSRKYLHQSAHWNILADKYLHSGVSLDLLYPNRPERDEQRKVLPNT